MHLPEQVLVESRRLPAKYAKTTQQYFVASISETFTPFLISPKTILPVVQASRLVHYSLSKYQS
jgi:hypothetical protein